MRWIALVLLVAGCPRPEPPAGSLVLGDDGLVGPQRPLVASGDWTDGLLELAVPSEWSGVSGVPAEALRVRLVHAPTGTTFEVWRDDVPARPGCTRELVDAGSFRSVPLLYPAASSTCVREVAGGAELVQSWSGTVRGHLITVEVLFPPGRHYVGLTAVDPLLSGLRAVR